MYDIQFRLENTFARETINKRCRYGDDNYDAYGNEDDDRAHVYDGDVNGDDDDDDEDGGNDGDFKIL